MELKILGDLSYFWQWDTNRKLIVEDGDTCEQVHYSNGEGDALVCVIKTVDGVRVADVPNILLQKSEPINAYMYAIKEDGTNTRASFLFKVRARSKPEDYLYTETEVLNYSYLDERLRYFEGEGLGQAIEEYLEDNPPRAGATSEEAAQIKQNKENIEKLSIDKLDAAKLPEAVNEALAQAKASGEFDGSPGEAGYTPVKGVDYYTEADKAELVDAVLAGIPAAEGVAF